TRSADLGSGKTRPPLVTSRARVGGLALLSAPQLPATQAPRIGFGGADARGRSGQTRPPSCSFGPRAGSFLRATTAVGRTSSRASSKALSPRSTAASSASPGSSYAQPVVAADAPKAARG